MALCGPLRCGGSVESDGMNGATKDQGKSLLGIRCFYCFPAFPRPAS